MKCGLLDDVPGHAEAHLDSVAALCVIKLVPVGMLNVLIETNRRGGMPCYRLPVKVAQGAHSFTSIQTSRWSDRSIHSWPGSSLAGQNTPQSTISSSADGKT